MTTNNIAVATSQISLNRNTINSLHLSIVSFKAWRVHAREAKDEHYVKMLNGAIKKATKKIACYTIVQKAAKKHLAGMISDSRRRIYVEQKRFPEIPSDWMDSCGEESV